MNLCASQQAAVCCEEQRRQLVRQSEALAGIDFVEVNRERGLCVHFFGHLPEGLTARNVAIEGGERITDICVLHAEFHHHDDGDTCLQIEVDKKGDFSTYCVCLVEPDEPGGSTNGPEPSNVRARCTTDEVSRSEPKVPAGIDPRYACAPFSFRVECPSTLDCKAHACLPAAARSRLAIDYLARDYASFRGLLLDRLSVTMPAWTERHAADLGITIVELLAYVADQLSYQQDAVATEAYLATARRRISVRRHARLVDYRMHEGCNARAWVTIESDADFEIRLDELAFAAPASDSSSLRGTISWEEMQAERGAIFEPLPFDGRDTLKVRANRNRIDFYTWRDQDCCLPAGSTRATLVDAPGDGLQLAIGDVLIFEQLASPVTGAATDADPAKRHAVRLTKVDAAVDPLDKQRLIEIAWHREDALPFALCLSARTEPHPNQEKIPSLSRQRSPGLEEQAPHLPPPAAPPPCKLVTTAVARSNVLLVDHGTWYEEGEWQVAVDAVDSCCLCDGAVVEVTRKAKPLTIELKRPDVTFAAAVSTASTISAQRLLTQDPRTAIAQILLDEKLLERPEWPGLYPWRVVSDLFESGPADEHLVAEIDDERRAHLRFGDGDTGRQPAAGSSFRARYRVGNGTNGNVGCDAIVQIARKKGLIAGVTLRVRNPLPASGGADAERITEVKRRAPFAYSRVLERAVAAADYVALALREARLQGAFADLEWNGSWYEATVALDPLAVAAADPSLFGDVAGVLEKARRIGHDLALVTARRVPLDIALLICAEPHQLRGEIERLGRSILSSGVGADGKRGLFHPDELRFGENVAASRIIAAVQWIPGVQHVELKRFARFDASEEDAAQSLLAQIIAIAADEIPQLDADPNFPERGILTLTVRGGR